MTTTLYYWKVWCVTENAWGYVWAPDAPSNCPNNVEHTINEEQVIVQDEISKTEVRVEEEKVKTGGHICCRSGYINTPANDIAQTNISWPFPVNILSLTFNITDLHFKDKLNAIVAPNTIIGTLASNCSIGQTELHVTGTVIENTAVGFHMNLFNGVNTDNLGRVLAIDEINSTITVETGPSMAYTASGPTTYVRQSIYVIEDYTIGYPSSYDLGKNKIGGTFLPPNTTIRVTYENFHGTDVELFSHIEFLY